MLAFFLSFFDDQSPKKTIKRLYDDHRCTVKNIIYNRVQDQAQVEDLCHETFVQMMLHADTVTALPEEQQKAYLFTVAKNVSINFLRKKDDLPLEEAAHMAADNGVDDFLDRQFTRDDFETAVRCIRALPDKYRDVLALHYVTGMKDTEIAALRRENINTVRSKIRRGRAMLIEALKKEGVER